MQRARIQESLANSNLTMTEQWNSETLLGGGNRSTYLEFMLVCVFTDGLSRLGSVNVFTNTHLPVDKWTLSNYSKKPVFTQIILKGEGGGGGEALQPPPSGFDFTTLSVNVTIQDYAYKATSKTDYLAIAMIATHCVIALAHTIFSLLRGTSSSCWDSITEFLAVAWGSSGRYAELQNTGAGIRNGTTFKNKVWLRVQDPERKIVLTFNERGDPSTDPTSNTLLSEGKAEDAEGDEEEEPRCEESTLNIPLAAAANVSSAIEGNRESTRASHHTQATIAQDETPILRAQTGQQPTIKEISHISSVMTMDFGQSQEADPKARGAWTGRLKRRLLGFSNMFHGRATRNNRTRRDKDKSAVRNARCVKVDELYS